MGSCSRLSSTSERQFGMLCRHRGSSAALCNLLLLIQAVAPAPLLAGSQGMLPRWASAYTGDGAPAASPVRSHSSMASFGRATTFAHSNNAAAVL